MSIESAIMSIKSENEFPEHICHIFKSLGLTVFEKIAYKTFTCDVCMAIFGSAFIPFSITNRAKHTVVLLLPFKL